MQNSSDFLGQYQELSQFEKILLQLLSIICEPAHSALVVNCMRSLNISTPRGNKPTTTNLGHYLTSLEKRGFLTPKRQVKEAYIEILCKIALKDGSYSTLAELVRKEAPVSYYYGKWATRCWRAVREMRIGIYSHDFDLIDESAGFLADQCQQIFAPPPVAVRVMTRPFDVEWLRGLPASLQFYLCSSVLRYGQMAIESYSDVVAFLSAEEEFAHLSTDEQLPFQRLLFNEYIFRGQLAAAGQLVAKNRKIFRGSGALGTVSFLAGDYSQALTAFEEDRTFLGKYSESGRIAFSGPAGLFYILTLLSLRETITYAAIADAISVALSLFPDAREADVYNFLAAVVESQMHKQTAGEIDLPEVRQQDALTVCFAAICQYWLSGSLSSPVEDVVSPLYSRALEKGFSLFALLFGEVLETTGHLDARQTDVLKSLRRQIGLVHILPLLEPEEPWKRSLQALIQATSQEAEQHRRTRRMIWLVSFTNEGIQLVPREQRLVADGEWSKGRAVSLSRLYTTEKFTYLTGYDRKICAAITKTDNPRLNTTSYTFDTEKMLVAMVGHPRLKLFNSPETPLECVSGEPEILVEEQKNNLHIRFVPAITPGNIIFTRETPTRVKIIRINDKHRRIAQITGKDGITVPRSAVQEVLTAIGNISSFMTVHSAIAVDGRQRGTTQIPFVEADASIYVHLLPYGTGFRLEMFVKPFAEGNLYLKPGQGVENLIAEVQGKRLQTKRDLVLEEQRARDIEELCPVLDLAIDMEQENEREWHLGDPDDCLQALLELQEIRDRVTVEWPEGEKLSITRQISRENLNLKIRTQSQDWFALSGEVEIDHDRLISLKELLLKARKSQSRFVEIDEGQFVALTQEFKKRLDDISLFSEGPSEDSGDELLLHPLAAVQLEQLTAHKKTTSDKGWKSHLQRLSKVRNLQPQLPSTLQADLRVYQRECYDWLARLAHWGVGGCLADDMGLGKTLQSLAIVLKLASKGPSLVVAPTSVSTNWHAEVQRFTPTLQIKTLGTKNRKKDIARLGKFDLLITTYTLLQQEHEMLSTVQWQTVILDEAQAIKNAATKRSQAAMGLHARFKLITTGTPIENHLGELWNLFHFINPGLLGSLRSFNERFAIPIERFQDRDAKLHLKKLIQPFILRRIKSQVLEELPSRTEVTLEVEMNKEEAHFYEALRQNAVDRLAQEKDRKGIHLQIFAEIMRLRQACCNPRLIDPQTRIESSKLKVFESIVEDLLAGHHKALVFSQFIEHLALIRRLLEQKGISYQYLDGKVAARQRKQRVDAFQAGEGEFFLISLKAGGLGLNLTAADYVIHMDPWWNPAIEDQASDRAHRIGQTRPVTIYRLVCKNSIEEKIIRLHQEKRALADTLLERTDISARMSSKELLALLVSPDVS
ncbi:MAG: helicase [Deltaproteobacteria bacterium]|nr:MAG: helicase [Deltaproteobacteria bacterium]